MYYKATVSGKIFDRRRLFILDDVFGPGTFTALVGDGTLVRIPKISVIDLIKSNQMYEAAHLYREIHKEATVKESLDMVKKIQADMDRFKNPKHCCSNCGFDRGSKCFCAVPCHNCSEWVPKHS